MIHKESVEAFEMEYKKQNISGSKLDGNGTTIFWYPNIPKSVKGAVRKHYNIDIDEEILYVKDTSLNGIRNQGTVITDCGIINIYRNDAPNKISRYSWDEIKGVECCTKDSHKLNILRYGGKKCVASIHLLEISPLVKNLELAGRTWARILTAVAYTQNKEASCKEGTNANEGEYIEEARLCLDESNEISSGARRLLDRRRKQLGISVERAAELESKVQHPQLSREEEEYMEEVKACIEESSKISMSARRLLNKLRERLGISEERAAEIENMCKTAK